jgi:hypothetical protein
MAKLPREWEYGPAVYIRGLTPTWSSSILYWSQLNLKPTLPKNKSKSQSEMGDETQIPEYDVLLVGAGFGSITTFHRYVLSPFLSWLQVVLDGFEADI